MFRTTLLSVGVVMLLVSGAAAQQVGIFNNQVTLDTTSIAYTPVAGTAVFSNGVYTLTGNGSDIWNKGDEGFFIYNELEGTHSISAKVKWLEGKGDAAGGSDWGKIGVMIRDVGNDPDSAHYWIDFRTGPGNPALGDRTDVQWRDTAKTDSGNVQVLKNGKDVASTSGLWYRVTRYAKNDTCVAEYSLDGVNWTVANIHKVKFGAKVAYGIIITSHKEDKAYIVKGEASDVVLVTSGNDNWELFK